MRPRERSKGKPMVPMIAIMNIMMNMERHAKLQTREGVHGGQKAIFGNERAPLYSSTGVQDARASFKF